jgi:hypothetical protein
MTPRSLVIVDTKYVKPFGEAAFAEITAAPDHAADAPRTVLLTRDDGAADRARAAEGSDQRFAITWRPARRRTGRACLMLERFEPLEAAHV